MTGPDDDMTIDMTAALTRTLRHRAEDAPSLDGLPEKAMVLASRRRRRRINASIAAIAVVAAAIPVAIVATVHGDTRPATQSDPAWRWESYRGVQVRVPSNWGYGVAGTAWCVAPSEGAPPPRVRPGAVGRPAPVPLIKCESDYPPVNERETWLSFDRRNQVGERDIDHGWVEETRRVNGVFITVFTNDDALRAAILGSAQPFTGTDRYGCPGDHPVAEDPRGYRPDRTTGGLPAATTVESISICRYSTEEDNPWDYTSDSASPLLSSGRIAGEGAKDLVNAVQSAPEGVGPDVEDASPGDIGTEIVLLRVDTADGTREVVVRYSGESGNGFDDGTTKRELTSDAISHFLTGANHPIQFFLPVARLLPN